MMTTTNPAPSRIADRVGRGLLALCAIATLGAFASGVAVIAAAPDDRLMVEGWRTLGYLVFAGLWTMLALRPRSVPGVWELVFLHKIAVSVYAFLILGAPEAGTAAVVDSLLVVITAAAYVLCRGWESWRGVTWTGNRPAIV